MNQPLVSLVLCVLDGMPYLPEAVESVRAQTYPNLELIVQDGCSTDGSLEYLRSLDGLPGLQLVSEPDRGIGEAYNRAYARCRGDIVGSIDADNLLDPNAVTTAVALFESHPDAVAIYGAVRMIGADGVT